MLRKDLIMYEDFFFDLGVRMHLMVLDELKSHGIDAETSLKTDAEIDGIIGQIMVNFGTD
tara:strand:- start:109 stop:288 length:180 start_codon:yes stop_codon:yes gene_type:complete